MKTKLFNFINVIPLATVGSLPLISITSCSKTCVITFDLGEGQEERIQTIDQDTAFKYIKKPNLPENTNEKCFVCWKYEDGTRVKANDKIKTDTKIYAYYRNDIMNDGPCCVYGLTDFTLSFTTNITTEPIPKLEYSYDKNIWTSLSSSPVTIQKGNTIFIRSSQSSGFLYEENTGKNSSINFGDNNEVFIGGEVSSLIGYKNIFTTSAFRELFKDNNSIFGISPTFFEKNKSNSIGKNCYRNMFSNCKNLEFLPNLPSTVLSDYCYADMFSECKSIYSIPSGMFPFETKYANFCYEEMFKNCTSLRISTETGTKFLTIKTTTDIGDISYPFNNIFSGTGGKYTNAKINSKPVVCYYY